MGLASLRLKMLTEHPVLCGAVYGLVVYLIMNRVVIPLSAAAHGTPKLPVLLNGLGIHVLGVGLPAAWAARVARGSGKSASPAG